MANAPKIFNVDKFATPKRVLVIDGAQHPIKTLTVQAFIDNLQTAERLAEEAKRGVADLRLSRQIEESVQAVAETVPSLPVERIRELRIEQLTAVLEFIRGDLDPNENALAPAEGAATEEGEATAKKPD